ncbi:MAG: hypothetical protein RLZZ546_2838 [Bacteroidota bacterium]|jgi:hypothetical protein
MVKNKELQELIQKMVIKKINQVWDKKFKPV